MASVEVYIFEQQQYEGDGSEILVLWQTSLSLQGSFYHFLPSKLSFFPKHNNVDRFVIIIKKSSSAKFEIVKIGVSSVCPYLNRMRASTRHTPPLTAGAPHLI
jgi:hypothetical protein